MMMLPSDTWSKETGWVKHHDDIDWPKYLDAIDELVQKRAGKVGKIDQWIQSSDVHGLSVRVQERLEAVKMSISNDYIDAEGCIKYQISGIELFEFYVMLAADGFNYAFDKPKIEHFQTLHLQDYEMSAIIEGKLTWNIVQWVALAEQHFLPDGVGKFWFWLEYYIDLNTKKRSSISG
jgi:hypothetical protein